MSSGAICGAICGEISNVLSIILLGIITLITFCVSLSSFIIGNQNWNVACDDGAFMSLSTWLCVIGTISLVCCIVAWIVYCIKHEGMSIMVGLTLIATIIVIVFNAMGSRILFTYASSCYTEAYSLWAITLAALIFQWIIMAFGFCAFGIFLIMMCVKD